ncbi:MAG TPA: DUF3108 domain-containing protein [Dissulfurispiraceae bacterium]|nr:DUF3108 domain-containing protein [Dissulfurispiraceae bacterium]
MALNYKERSYGKIILFAVAASVLLHVLLFVLLSEVEIDLFSMLPDKEIAVTMIEPKESPPRMQQQASQPKPSQRKPSPEERSDTFPSKPETRSDGEGAGGARPEEVHKPPQVVESPQPAESEEVVALLSVKKELLKYDLYWSGVYVGMAELEASHGDGSFMITSKARSAGVISAFYTVDDFAQSILLNGRPYSFRFRQHEGKNRGNKETKFDPLTKKISFSNAVKNVSSEHDLPATPLWDILSAFYYVRIKPLEVGKKVGIDIFDSGKFARVGVDVLKREQVDIPDFGKFNAVVIKPNVETEGLFKKKGDIFIWLSDDDQRIPLRVETIVPIGKVTAELRGRSVEKLDTPGEQRTK